MTPDQLEQQSRDAVKSYLDDSSIRLEFKMKCNKNWMPMITVGYFNIMTYYYRIAQPKPWYRVALHSNGGTNTVDNERYEQQYEVSEKFVKWLTDRIEYSNE